MPAVLHLCFNSCAEHVMVLMNDTHLRPHDGLHESVNDLVQGSPGRDRFAKIGFRLSSCRCAWRRASPASDLPSSIGCTAAYSGSCCTAAAAAAAADGVSLQGTQVGDSSLIMQQAAKAIRQSICYC